jgi:hypothetical protein
VSAVSTWGLPSGVTVGRFVPGPRGGRIVLLTDEPRVVLAAIIEAPLGPMTVATTHLSFVPGWNVRQLHRTQRALRELSAPRLLLATSTCPAGSCGSSLAGACSPADPPTPQRDHVSNLIMYCWTRKVRRAFHPFKRARLRRSRSSTTAPHRRTDGIVSQI